VDRWTESLVALADAAEACGIQLCIEHFPRRALPTVAATLQFLEGLGHSSLRLLIDVGHCLISAEDAAEAVIKAGDRLGYLHFDDNDGVDDLHWALLDGRLTEAQITAVIKAQRSAGYRGALCIELNPRLDGPLENLRRSSEALHRCAVDNYRSVAG
jgi:sugar phosphate isomerase/epimerase